MVQTVVHSSLAAIAGEVFGAVAHELVHTHARGADITIVPNAVGGSLVEGQAGTGPSGAGRAAVGVVVAAGLGDVGRGAQVFEQREAGCAFGAVAVGTAGRQFTAAALLASEIGKMLTAAAIVIAIGLTAGVS